MRGDRAFRVHKEASDNVEQVKLIYSGKLQYMFKV